MRKTIKALLIVGSLGALCAGLAACSNETKVDEYFKNGNIISVTYDGSGGNILGNNNVSIVDMFNPEKYTADSNGYVHIKLRSPTDPSRPKPGVDPISVLRSGYSLVGWYRTREIVKDGDNVYDDKGNKLVEQDGDYYKVTVNSEGDEVLEPAIPRYTFADPWDFTKDTVDFKVGDERLDITLYAAWVPLFSFEYYYKVNNVWTPFATTTFDYPTAQTIDREDLTKVTDSVFVPDWSTETGRMEYKYSNVYTFPSVKDKALTFKAAYTDENCQDEITRENPYQHKGYIDYTTASAIGDVQKVYVEFDEGNRYRISTAQQFAAIADLAGYYTILTDELDFNCRLSESGELTFPTDSVRWPNGFTSATFTGRIEGEDGKAVTFKNVGAQYNNADVELGGLFGAIGKAAVIKNVTFENVIFDIRSATGRKEAKIGMFAGRIDEGATVQTVNVGGQMMLRELSTPGDRFKVNLLIAGGEKSGVSATKLVLKVYGDKQLGTTTERYMYFINPDSVAIDSDLNITFQGTNQNTRYQTKQHFTKYGGDDNEENE